MTLLTSLTPSIDAPVDVVGELGVDRVFWVGGVVRAPDFWDEQTAGRENPPDPWLRGLWALLPPLPNGGTPPNDVSKGRDDHPLGPRRRLLPLTM